MKDKKIFSKIVMVLMICSSFISFAQGYKTELRMLDEEQGNIHAGLIFTGISKPVFDKIIEKAGSLKMYAVSAPEFTEGKNVGFFTLQSTSSSSLLDLQAFLKQLEIFSLDYNGKTISTQDINSSYKPVNKTEVINKQRN